MKGSLEVESLPLRELCEGNLEEGLLYYGLLSKALKIGVCFHRVSTFGEHAETLLS